MCGVGKFMQQWKEHNNIDCPRCGAFDDVPHVWLCPDNQATQIWENSINTLQEWIISIDTDPNIQAAVFKHLKGRCSSTVISSHHTPNLQDAVHQQNLLGRQLFFECWILQDWAGMQQPHYNMIKSCRSEKRWATSIINPANSHEWY